METLWLNSRYKVTLFFLVAVTLSTLSFNLKAEESLVALKPYHISYNVIHDNDKVGTASRTLTQLTNGQWQLAMQSDISYYFLSDERQEISRFEVVGKQIFPLIYKRHSETSLRSDRTLLQNFDWDNHVEHGSFKDDQWTQPLKIGYLDQLTQLTLIREYLLTQKPLPAIDISYRGTIRHHEFQVIGQETLETKKGPVETAKIQLKETSRDRQTNIWFAIEHEMLPLQIQRIKEGEEQAKIIASDW